VIGAGAQHPAFARPAPEVVAFRVR